jgi:hypothetical protein
MPRPDFEDAETVARCRAEVEWMERRTINIMAIAVNKGMAR